MSTSTYREILGRIAKISASCILGPFSRRTATPSTEPAEQRTFPPLVLEIPAEFSALLRDVNLSQPFRDQVLAAAHRTIDEQKAIHEKKYQEACNKFLELNIPSSSTNHSAYFDKMRIAFENSFQRQILRLKEKFVETYEEVCGSLHSRKPTFNAEYTPVLEQYFEYNAFPSARDRELLARKSSMTPRQIEVWFQNHRRRARKEGRPLRRITTDPLPANLTLDTLQKRMPAFMIQKEERRSPLLDVENVPEKLRRTSPSPPPAPAPVHATGTSLDHAISSSTTLLARYSPRDGATLFSTPQRFTFEAPNWYRKASSPSSTRSSSPPLSIEDLCSDVITKLHISGAGSIRKQRDPVSLDRSVATRRRFALEALPTNVPPPAAMSTTRIRASSDDAPIAFGSTSFLRCSKRHQPYDRSLRKYPTWSLDKPETRPCTPQPSFRARSHIPRRPSVSYSSSGSSLCSDPPTPRDSPNAFAIQPLPFDSPDTLCDPYAFDFSADILVTSSYPSSTERYAPYKKPSRFSRAPSPSYPRFSAY